jgi:hypothetical protein
MIRWDWNAGGLTTGTTREAEPADYRFFAG